MSELPSECEQLLISGYVLGNLSPAEATLFEEMLKDNPELNDRVMAMQGVLDLAFAPPEMTPPSGLRDRILATADAQKTNVSASPEVVSTAPVDNEVSSPRESRIVGKILGAIALAVIAILGIVNYRLWQTTKIATPNLPNLEVEKNTYLLRGQDLPPTTTVELVTQSNLNATLTANNLPPLPKNKAYALWTVVGNDVPYTTDSKGAILTAVFQVDESGNFQSEIAVPQPHLEPRTINKMAVTVEDISAPQAHAGSILLSTGDELQSRF